jgi:hypothetical protein
MPSARACLAVIIFTAALCGSAQAQVTSTSKTTDKDEDQIAQLERDWLAADARGDAASLGKIVADDFIGSTFNGHLLSKQDIIPQGGGPSGFAGDSVRKQRAHLWAKLASTHAEELSLLIIDYQPVQVKLKLRGSASVVEFAWGFSHYISQQRG